MKLIPNTFSSSSAHINANQNTEVLNSVTEAAFSQQPQEGANQYNMQLLAQHAVQNHPQLAQPPTQQPKAIQQNGKIFIILSLMRDYKYVISNKKPHN